MKRRKKNAFAFVFALIGALFLIFSGTTGFAALKQIETIVLLFVNEGLIKIIFTIILIIASLGGIAVFAGGILILKEKVRLGRIIIFLGAGAGLTTLIIHAVFMIITKQFSLTWFLSSATTGIMFCILARRIAKPKVSRAKRLKRINK